MKNLVAKLVVVGTLSALVLGCGSTKTADNSPVVPGESSGAKTKVVFIPKSAGNPYFARVEEGFKKATDIDFSTQAPQSADATSQISVLKDQVQRGQQVIVLSPNSPDALNETLDQITAKGVTVITADSDLTGNESHRTVGVLPVDFSTIGPEQVELLGSMINYEGEFAI
ncbi:MAG TPA: substrate-binding domain-containing protein, partial [Fimbriimonas sp.]|nr:substrate-binding domain-containing protein [Fimbriimonas sp.]